jgi:hypothetical protein
LLAYGKVEILEVIFLQMGIAMTTSTIRKKLINFISDADEKKIKEMYMLFEEEIEKEEAFRLAEEHIAILDARREKHVSGKSKSYRWSQAKQIIMGKKSI